MTPALRRKVIAEWRGLPEPPPKPDRMQPVSEIVPKWMKTLGLEERLNEAQIQAVWRELVGDFIATHSTPSRLRSGVLLVQVVQPTVRFELERHWKPELVRRLKERFGANRIKDVKFVLG